MVKGPTQIEMVEISRFSFDNPRFKALLGRQTQTPLEVLETVSRIIEDVRERRDAALFDYMKQYDGVDLSESGPRVSEEEFEAARERVPEGFPQAVEQACANLLKFHQHQLQKSFRVEYPDGVLLERRVKPIDRVGITVPSGAAPLASSLYMNLVPAMVAGVPEIYIICAPREGSVHPAILHTAEYLGVKTLYRISGAQGIAALAFGTESVQAVDKIVGPGNIYVQTAKKFLFGTVGIDSLAGPSEIVILADGSANPEYAAADLLSQSEHGTGLEAAIVLSPSRQLLEQVQAHVQGFLRDPVLRRRCSPALEKFGNLFLVESMTEAVDAANAIAPEHVELLCRNAERLADRIVNAGAIFVGESSPEPVGDYFCGTNHVLPTGGTARFSSGLGVADFLRSYSVVHYSGPALQRHRSTMLALIRPEEMRAHMLSLQVRGKSS